MFFDDRLATVLRQRATGEASLRTQYRQLLDLLGKDRVRRHGSADPSLLAAAWLRMDALAEAIPAEARARMIREPGWRFHSADLASHLSDQEPEVAAAALNRADLESADWTALIPRLPVRARGFLRLRRDLPVEVDALLARLGVHDRGLPPPAPAPALIERPQPTASEPAALDQLREPGVSAQSPFPLRIAASAAPRPAPRNLDDTGRTEISALVERIAQFRRTRGESPLELERSPRLPLGELPERTERIITSFGFAADTAGRIGWATSEVAPMVIGARLFSPQQRETLVGECPVARAFARRQPVTRGEISLSGAPAIAGEWIVDAEPRFSEDGHFTGYFGRFRRVADAARFAPTGPEAREADRIRLLLHELRTPITAVQGYAEVIQQQLFGPAPHEYRALAAAIAADAARILAGFEELDRLARLETGAIAVESGESDLAALVCRIAAQLAPVLEPQDQGLTITFAETAAILITLDPDDAEALLWRLLASLAGACASGERIAVRLDPLIGAGGAMARLVCTLPARLAAEDNLFAATTRASDSVINAGLFGAGFALRLARAEARAAGGNLRRDGAAVELTLPLMTENPGLPSAARAIGA